MTDHTDPIEKIFLTILKSAYGREVRELHIVPSAEKISIMYLEEGSFYQAISLPCGVYKPLTSLILERAGIPQFDSTNGSFIEKVGKQTLSLDVTVKQGDFADIVMLRISK